MVRTRNGIWTPTLDETKHFCTHLYFSWYVEISYIIRLTMNDFQYIICVFIMSHSPTQVMGFLQKNKYWFIYNLQFITLKIVVNISLALEHVWYTTMIYLDWKRHPTYLSPHEKYISQVFTTHDTFMFIIH